MEISQHIKNLLLTNTRVILGDFGAFETKHIPARIDKETKTMTPPFKIVVFNPEVKEDAGLLAKHMAEKEGISFESASEQISEFVKTVKTKLDNGDTVMFTDLGEFKKGPTGKPEFSYLSEDNLLLDSFGLPKVSLSEESKTVKDKPAEENLRKEPIKKKTPEKKAIQKPLKKTPPVKKQKHPKPKKEKTGKKKRFLPVLLIILGVIGILFAAVYFFKPDLWKKGYDFTSQKIASVTGGNKEKLEVITPEEDIQPEEMTEEVADTAINNEITADDTVYADEVSEVQPEDNEVQADEITEDDTQSEVAEINRSTSSASPGKYYIIVGSVKSEPAAQKEQKRFAAKGISTDIIYVPHMDRYRISLGEFSSAKAAQDFFTDFQNQHGNIDAWVWEKK